MKNSVYIFLLFLIPCMVFAQKEPRELLRGRIAADSLMVENINVKNITSNIAAVTDVVGNFTIYARPADTLVFSGLAVRDAMLVVKKEHFTEKRLIINLDVNVTVLDEVRVSTLTGNLEKDSKAMKGKQLTPQFNSGDIVRSDVKNNLREYKYSEEKNMLTDPVNREMHGLNFVGLYKAIFKKKKKKDTLQYYTQRNFTEVVQERFTYHFFTVTLKIPKDEIGLFLTYCDKGNKTQSLLNPAKEFELTDYLVTQSAAYLKTRN